MNTALLVLEDGTAYEGLAHGADGHSFGEVVFNTSMSGYQEILTDPSYAGQLVIMTQPHIGNYGVSPADMESSDIKAAGLIVRSMSTFPSNYRSTTSLPDWLAQEDRPAISDIDTRALTRHIRDKGVMMGVIACGATMADKDQWLEKLKAQPDYGDRDFVQETAVDGVHHVVVDDLDHGTAIRLEPGKHASADHVVVLDFGVKHSILRNLAKRGVPVTVLPSTASIDEILAQQPKGVMVSNGPGDPARLDEHLETIRALADNVPTWGICLGHQLIARAFGATTFKLPFGHRGPNQPVQDLATGVVQMTSQNHGYAVDADALPEDLEVTQINLNDNTVEALKHKALPVSAVQYHPEAGPGPHDAENFFDAFIRQVESA